MSEARINEINNEKKVNSDNNIEAINKAIAPTPLSEKNYQSENTPGEKFVPKVHADVEKSLKEQGLIPDNFEALPSAERITFADQAQKTIDLISSDPERARKILRGEESLPSDMRAGFFLKGMEDLITKNKDAEMAYEWMNTPIAKETSIHAQETASMRALQPDSMLSQVSDIKKAREKNVEKSTGKKIDKAQTETIKEIKKQVNKESAPKIKDWASFIDSIKCK